MIKKNRLLRKFPLLSLLYFVLLLCGCTQVKKRSEEYERWVRNTGEVKVLCTTGMIADTVKLVGQDKVDVLTLIHEELDPHTYQLVKGDSEKLEFADVIFFNGLELEHGPTLKEALRSSNKSFAIGGWIEKSDPEKLLFHNGQVDPHIWMDVSLWVKSIPFIAKTLSDIDPVNKEFYEENAKIQFQKLKKLDQEVYELMQAIPEQKRYLVTSHDAFQYFTRRYLATDQERKERSWGKRFQAPEGLAPDSQVSPIDIYTIVEHLRTYDIEVIFPESNVSALSLKKIQESALAKGLSVRIASCSLFSDSLGRKGAIGDTYRKMISHNAKQIAKYLSGKAGFNEKCE